MKKLIIAAAIVCAAAFAQAAQIQWKVSGVTEVGGQSLESNNYSVYGFITSDSSMQNPTFTTQQIIDMVLAYQDPYDAGLATGGIGVDGSGVVEGSVVVTGASEGSPITMHAYALVTDSWNFTDPTEEFGPLVGNYQIVDCGEVKFMKDATLTAAGTAGAWSTVPEPTSGLLLLLGVAGLALRRRRA